MSQGVAEIDQILTVLFKTGMAVAGILSVILDNLVPGTPEERGLIQWQVIEEPTKKDETAVKDLRVYDLPFGVGNSWKISRFLPFMPYYPEKKRDREQEVITLQEHHRKSNQENINS